MNANMLCPLRTGQGRIEYNPTAIDELKDNKLRDLLKVEMVRILLQHPYTRRPLGCNPIVLRMASDMVISPAYRFNCLEMAAPPDFGLPEGQHYEWYALRLNEIFASKIDPRSGDPEEKNGGPELDIDFPTDAGGGGKQSPEDKETGNNGGNSGGEGEADEGKEGLGNDSSGNEGQEGPDQDTEGSGGGKGQEMSDEDEEPHGGPQAEDPDVTANEADYTALWEEDAFQARKIIDTIQSTTQWGSLPGGMVDLIKEAVAGRIDYRDSLRGFRSSILSQKRRLTRMRPSRRFGFEQMGSRYDFTTRLLVAIDTSCSVGSEELGRYLHVINTFFKYGIEEIDVVMFDTRIESDPLTLKKARKMKSLPVKGRGGTDFQAPVDYLADHPCYDGLIIITDGYAPVPTVPVHMVPRLLWVIDNEKAFKVMYEKLRKTGRVCLMQI